MGGVDYDVAKKMSLSGRLGAEWREREAEQDTTSPYAEVSGEIRLHREILLSSAATSTRSRRHREPERFTDAKVHRFFVNVQHAVTALIVASGSVTYEPSTLQGRRRDPRECVREDGARRRGAQLSADEELDHFGELRLRPRALRRSRRANCGGSASALSATYTF